MNCLLKSQETDFLAMKGPYDELTEEAGPSKRCKGIDSVTSFPFSKRVQTTSIPVTQDCNDKHTNLRGNDECFVNRTALHEEGKSIEVNVSHKVKVTAPLATEEKHEEIDPHRLSQRQKQIDYGKNTLGYERYIELVPRAAFMCGREPNFELSEEEKQELRRFNWEEFLALTRNAITNKRGLLQNSSQNEEAKLASFEHQKKIEAGMRKKQATYTPPSEQAVNTQATTVQAGDAGVSNF